MVPSLVRRLEGYDSLLLGFAAHPEERLEAFLGLAVWLLWPVPLLGELLQQGLPSERGRQDLVAPVEEAARVFLVVGAGVVDVVVVLKWYVS